MLNDAVVELTQASTGKRLIFFKDDVLYVLAGENGSLLKLKDDDTVWEVDEIITKDNLEANFYGAKNNE